MVILQKGCQNKARQRARLHLPLGLGCAGSESQTELGPAGLLKPALHGVSFPATALPPPSPQPTWKGLVFLFSFPQTHMAAAPGGSGEFLLIFLLLPHSRWCQGAGGVWLSSISPPPCLVPGSTSLALTQDNLAWIMDYKSWSHRADHFAGFVKLISLHVAVRSGKLRLP